MNTGKKNIKGAKKYFLKVPKKSIQQKTILVQQRIMQRKYAFNSIPKLYDRLYKKEKFRCFSKYFHGVPGSKFQV